MVVWLYWYQMQTSSQPQAELLITMSGTPPLLVALLSIDTVVLHFQYFHMELLFPGNWVLSTLLTG